MEKGHARFWREFLKRRDEDIPQAKGRIGQTFVSLLSRVINPLLVVGLLEMGEAKAYTTYYEFLKFHGEELSLEELQALRTIILDELSHESFFREKIEEMGLSNIRDMVLGMNDGLVELLGVVAGLSAVYRNEPFIVGASAMVVGVAGAISMGIGAFISVRSQRQVNEAIREREKIVAELSGKKVETAELAEESELKASLFTGLSYMTGVAFPVVPFFLLDDSLTALMLSVILAVLILGCVGVLVAFLSGISIGKKVSEMILSALLATLASFSVGKLVKVAFSIEVEP